MPIMIMIMIRYAVETRISHHAAPITVIKELRNARLVPNGLRFQTHYSFKTSMSHLLRNPQPSLAKNLRCDGTNHTDRCAWLEQGRSKHIINYFAYEVLNSLDYKIISAPRVPCQFVTF